jgi:hypothetical protein
MAKESHKQERHAPTAAAQQQQLIWRALVGSLFFCAALAAPARAQAATPESQGVPQEAETASVPTVNTNPFRDLLAKALRLRADGSLNTEDTFDFTVEADRAENGTLSNVAVGGSASNQRLYELARDFIAALGDSRLLAPFKDALHVSLRLRLDAQTALASATLDAASEERARQAANGYAGIFYISSVSKRGTDLGLALKNVQVSSSGKQIAFRLEMSREQLGNLLRQSLSLP